MEDDDLQYPPALTQAAQDLRCGHALYIEGSTIPDRYWFCQRKDGHGGKHRDGLKRWSHTRCMSPLERHLLLKYLRSF